ncbi:N-acetylmuramoyl-L-alanine amidase [Horticoccus sp. 23ND18S-11]|uniref:N-acetylmuramoyl-L-alanine amidase n=1 Tax=Horticoccus sp. 23ND18S-11 TaxID=3391832 RepID=UPI0039C94D1A
MKLTFLGLACVCAALSTAAQTAAPPDLRSDVATAVARVLVPDTPAMPASTPSATGASSVRLLGVDINGNRLSLDFSRELLGLAPGSLAFEQFSRRIHIAVGDLLRRAFDDFEVVSRIEGVPLDRLFAPLPEPRPAVARQLAPPSPDAPLSAHALSSRRIAISPGHGYYLNGTSWVLQRGFWQGIVEDFVNHDFITLLNTSLAAAGADVRPTRNLDRTAGIGESGFAKWQEAARYHVKALGADASVWNEAGFTHLEQDIRSRPRYANAVNADILVSLHNNGGAGTGTETLYDNANTAATESKRLADILHARVITAIRREYNPAWVDRRVQGFNGSYGENRLATRPAILMEVAFMDRPVPDNAALQDDAFKRIVTDALHDGIQEYFDGPAAVMPVAPSTLLATAGGPAITLTWTDASTNETGFRVERKAPASAAWENHASLGANVSSFTDTTVAPGATYQYRVSAFNAAGRSRQFSNEATAALTPPDPGPASPPSAEAWLSNLSLRTTLTSGRTVTVGFVVGAGSRNVVVRAAGPALAAFGLVTPMADPRLELYRAATKILENNDWPAALAPIVAALGGFPFAPASRDAALLQTFAGAYTVQATGTTAGTVLIEGYDAGSGGSGRLVNLSARNRVGTGTDILIAGFFVAGTGQKRVVIRAVGPTLATLGVTGVLADPRLDVFDQAGARLAENDTWDPALAPTFAQVGAFALDAGSRDAALVLTLNAGRSYTAQVSGVANGTGEALVEVYELP